MTDNLWNLFKITLQVTYQRNPNEAIILVEDFIYNTIFKESIINKRLSMILKLKEIIRELNET